MNIRQVLFEALELERIHAVDLLPRSHGQAKTIYQIFDLVEQVKSRPKPAKSEREKSAFLPRPTLELMCQDLSHKKHWKGTMEEGKATARCLVCGKTWPVPTELMP